MEAPSLGNPHSDPTSSFLFEIPAVFWEKGKKVLKDPPGAPPSGWVFSRAPISAVPGPVFPSPLVAPDALLAVIPSSPSHLSNDPPTSTASVPSPSEDQSGSAPVKPSTSEQPASAPSLSVDESGSASIITAASLHPASVPSPSGDESGSAPARPSTSDQAASVPSPIRDQSGSAFDSDEDYELFLSEYESEADTNEDSELFLSDYESEDPNSEADANSGADINSEAESEAETGLSSSDSDNSHPDPSRRCHSSL